MPLLDRTGANYATLRRWLGTFVAEPVWEADDRSCSSWPTSAVAGSRKSHCSPATRADLQGPLKEEVEAFLGRLGKIKPITDFEKQLLPLVTQRLSALRGEGPLAAGTATKTASSSSAAAARATGSSFGAGPQKRKDSGAGHGHDLPAARIARSCTWCAARRKPVARAVRLPPAVLRAARAAASWLGRALLLLLLLAGGGGLSGHRSAGLIGHSCSNGRDRPAAGLPSRCTQRHWRFWTAMSRRRSWPNRTIAASWNSSPPAPGQGPGAGKDFGQLFPRRRSRRGAGGNRAAQGARFDGASSPPASAWRWAARVPLKVIGKIRQRPGDRSLRHGQPGCRKTRTWPAWPAAESKAATKAKRPSKPDSRARPKLGPKLRLPSP